VVLDGRIRHSLDNGSMGDPTVMQLDALILYGPVGTTRRIDFRHGQLNVITGDSATGKSSLINIIRFLLGSGSPHSPLGPIQETVTWYGLLTTVRSTRIFIGRPAPPHGSETSQVMLTIGTRSEPAPGELRPNSNTEDLRRYLTGALGFEENLNVPEVGQTRRPLEATFVHSLHYCFQGQGEIANPNILFHRQNLEWQPQTIRDTLPYFIGAQGIDALRQREELTQLRRALRRASLALSDAVAIRDRGAGRAAALLAEARDAGLIRAEYSTGSFDEAVEALQGALSADFGPDLEESDAEFERLVEARFTLQQQMRTLNAQLRGLDDFASVGKDYADELNEHRARLASIGLIPDEVDGASCPLCGTGLAPTRGSQREAIARHLGQIELRLEYSDRDRPRISLARTSLLDQREGVRSQLRDVGAALDSLGRSEESRSDAASRWNSQSFTRGRIAQFIEGVRPASDRDSIPALESDIAGLERQIVALSAQLDSDALRSRVDSILNIIGRRLTDHAQSLGLEHSRTGARIDPYRLTIVADTVNGPAYMDSGEIGSGMNWVGYHLSAYLALQEFFVERERPVPSFIIVDQPSQAFFPRDREAGGDLSELTDVDRDNTRRLYRLMYDVAESMNGGLQIIALDHADFDDEWFSQSVIERWRGGSALIPSAWVNRHD
jgi:hypothetical protein